MKTNEAYRAAIEQKAAALLQRRKRRNRLLCTLIPTGGCAAVACAALLLSGAPADASSLPAAGTGPSAQSTAGSNLSSGAQTEGTAPLPALESIEFAELGGIGIGLPALLRSRNHLRRNLDPPAGRGLYRPQPDPSVRPSRPGLSGRRELPGLPQQRRHHGL